MKPFSACVFVALLGYYQCEANPSGLSKWNEFKAKHAKQHSGDEDMVRMQRFLEKDAEIAEHNAKYARGEVSYSTGHNQYSDMSSDEIKRFAFGLNAPQNLTNIPFADVIPSGVSAPVNFDWRSQGAITYVKDQQNCGSCYAFAATSLIEAFLMIRGKGSMDAAEQDAVDCSIQRYRDSEAGLQNMGCQGGWPTSVLQFYIQTGLLHENSYPYYSGRTESHGQCRKNGAQVSLAGAQIRHFRASEAQMVDILVSKGPILIGMAADNEDKKNIIGLREGIFDNAATINRPPNHAVVLVGYGVENGTPYWVIKNSWGETWGVKGFGKIVRGKNMCNILSGGIWYLE